MIKISYQEHLPTQRPAPPRTVKITQSNWKEFIEKPELWTDYVDFFSNEVQQLGIDEAVNKYFFLPEMFGRFFSGINHGIIHLGFGVAFKEPLIVAEGLSLAALASDLEFVRKIPPPSSSTTSLLNIIEQVRNDKRLEGILKPRNISRKHVLRESTPLIHEYISKWDINEGNVAEKEKELVEMIALLYAAPVRPGKRPIFDFYVMHSVTGSVFVHELLKHFSSERGAQVLKAHLGITLYYYIATACPQLHIDYLKSYKTQLPSSPNPWLEIIKFGIETNDVHATKVAYSLLQFEAWFGEFDGIFLKAAQITADAIRAQPNVGISQDKVWSFDRLGFEETWEA